MFFMDFDEAESETVDAEMKVVSSIDNSRMLLLGDL